MTREELLEFVDREVMVRSVIRRVHESPSGEIVVYLEVFNGETPSSPPGSPMFAWYNSAPPDAIQIPAERGGRINILRIHNGGQCINAKEVARQREENQSSLFQ